MFSISEELEQLTADCQELHRQHHDALGTLECIHRHVDQGEGITVHYQCEDRGFGDVLEELHVRAMEDVEKGGPVRFGTVLLEALQYAIFPSDSKN